MNGPLISSLSINIFLFMLFLLMTLLYITKTGPVIQNNQSQVCPIVDGTPRTSPPFMINTSYLLKTLSGLYIQTCFGCLPTPVACFNQGIVASKEWNGDTIELIPKDNMYHIKINSKFNPTGKYYLNMVRVNESYVLCLTQNENQPTAMFQILTYISSNRQGTNLFQIGTPITGSLIGEGNVSCLVKEGIPIVDGYNISVNAPKGMDEKSFFLMLPAASI